MSIKEEPDKNQEDGTGRISLSRGQFSIPLQELITARQHFLDAVSRMTETRWVLKGERSPKCPKSAKQTKPDLTLDQVYHEVRRTGCNIHAQLNRWCWRNNLVTRARTPLDWVKSCAEYTLAGWALHHEHYWPWPEGRPRLPARPGDWARYDDLPAFETWIDHDLARALAGPGVILSDEDTFIALLPNGRLAYTDNYETILSYGPFGKVPGEVCSITFRGRYDPEKEKRTEAEKRLRGDFERWLATSLDGIDSYLLERNESAELSDGRADLQKLGWLARTTVCKIPSEKLAEQQTMVTGAAIRKSNERVKELLRWDTQSVPIVRLSQLRNL